MDIVGLAQSHGRVAGTARAAARSGSAGPLAHRQRNRPFRAAGGDIRARRRFDPDLHRLHPPSPYFGPRPPASCKRPFRKPEGPFLITSL